MADVTIKNVPEGAEAAVKSMSMVAIERFIRNKDMIILEETETKFKEDIDTIFVANDLPKKYDRAEEEEVK